MACTASGRTVAPMAPAEEVNNLPTPAQQPGSAEVDVTNVSDEEARRALANIATGDPTVRKRIFSALLRSISVGGS